MQQNIPRGTAVAYTSGIGEFALEERGYQAVPLRFRPDMERKGIQYYVISTKNVNEGYSFASPESVAKLTATSRSLFSAHGPSAGSLILYQLDIPPR